MRDGEREDGCRCRGWVACACACACAIGSATIRNICNFVPPGMVVLTNTKALIGNLNVVSYDDCVTMPSPPQTSKAFQSAEPIWTQSKNIIVNDDILHNTQLHTANDSITISDLPLELFSVIFSFCTPIDLYGKIRRVCRRFNTIALLLLRSEFILLSRINLRTFPFNCEVNKRLLVPWPYIHCEPKDSAEDPKLFTWTGEAEDLAPVWDRIGEGNKIVYFVTSPPWDSQYLFKSHCKVPKRKSIWTSFYPIKSAHQSNTRDIHTFTCDGNINWKIVYSKISTEKGKKSKYVVDIMLPLKELLEAYSFYEWSYHPEKIVLQYRMATERFCRLFNAK